MSASVTNRLTSLFAGCVLVDFASLGDASQPGAIAPVAAPMCNLTWGQLNFLHTTDIHGWLGGHLQEPQYSADWGDYISFTHHMHKRADDRGVDLLLIDSGDRVEGNGLYDASMPKGRYYYDLFVQQELDIICVGNNELYQASTFSRERNSTVRDYRRSYIASNVDYINTNTGERTPLAQRYRRFRTKNQKLNVIAFGFLFDFTGNANNSIVQPVAETVQEKWFQDAIREKPDVFIVVGHIALRMSEIRTIFNAIRKLNWHAPIVLFGGHAHVRDAVRFDSQSLALASGRYLETIGWVSMDGLKVKGLDDFPLAEKGSLSFTRRYIDNNLYGMYHTGLNKTAFPTKLGQRTSGLIAKARKALDLDHTYGCAPQNFWVNRAPFPSNESIFTWLQDQVLPDIIINKTRGDIPRLAIINTGGIHFDIFRCPFTRDSACIVSPFRNGLSYVPDVPFGIARRVIGILNSGTSVSDFTFLAAQSPEKMDSISLPDATSQFELRRFKRRAYGSHSNIEELSIGYTTSDDMGTDGDDTVHKSLQRYDVPNCIQAEIAFKTSGFATIREPEKVDLVFLDFLQPWIIPALKFSGGDYSDKDVSRYTEMSFTDLLVDWISNHWADNC